MLGVDAGDASAVAADGGDLQVLKDLDPARPRAFGERLGDVDGVAVAVARDVNAADHIVEIGERIQIADFGRRYDMHRQLENLGHGGVALELFHASGGRCERDGSALPVARRLAGLGLEPSIQLRRVAREPRHVHALTQLSDQTRRMPGGAARELLALEQHDVAPAELGQMVGDGAADDAAADDDDPGVLGKIGHAQARIRALSGS